MDNKRTPYLVPGLSKNPRREENQHLNERDAVAMVLGMEGGQSEMGSVPLKGGGMECLS